MRTGKRKEIELFGMAFLDIVACGFGAMIMLLLLAKNGEVSTQEPPLAKNIVEKVTLEKKLQSLRSQIVGMEEAHKKLDKRSARLTAQSTDLEANNTKSKATLAQKQSQLEIVQQQIIATSSTNSDGGQGTVNSEFSAGIPVGAKNIVFIVDTSGSMKQQWASLVATISSILEIHPKVDGFQVLSDNGQYLLRRHSSGYIPDTKSTRASALKALNDWYADSNSSPAEGLEKALKTYAKANTSLSIYVLGDDYTGASYDDVLSVIDRYNKSSITGKRIARIHGIEFKPGRGGDRFATLMREVAYRNNGVFLTL